MNKVTTAALAGLVAVTATANASMSRWNGFGDIGSAFIADVQDIWTLPGVVASHKNAMYLELGAGTPGGVPATATTINGRPTNVWGGVHTELGPGVLGVWVGRGQSAGVSGLYSLLTTVENSNIPASGTPSLDAVFGGTTFGDADTAGNSSGNLSGSELNAANSPAGRVDLLYGFPLSDTADLGVLLSMGGNGRRWEDGDTGTVVTADGNVLGFGLGAELKEVGPFSLLEVGLVVDMDSNKISVKSTGSTDEATASVSVFGLRVGGDMAGDDGAFSRVELGLKSGSANMTNKEDGGAAVGNKEEKASGMAWNLGYALGKSGDNGLGLLGTMLTGTTTSNETDADNTKNESSELSLLVGAAGEAKLSSWAKGRAGLTQNLYKSKTSKAPNTGVPTKSDTTTISGNGSATVTTGLSLALGNWTLDGVLNQDVLFNGTYLISGIPDALFGQVSATLVW